MNYQKKDKVFLYFTFSLTLLLIITSYCGIFIKETYARELYNWQVQSIGQDIINLFVAVPVLLISGIFSYYGKKIFYFIFAGAVLFIAYSYIIYCFNIHFNYLFLLYCFTLGIAAYGFIYCISFLRRASSDHWFFAKAPVKPIGIFLLLTAIVFIFLWLKEILPAVIPNRTPDVLAETGLWTNPVHVLDLALLLPGLIIVSILFIKRTLMGFILAPVMMTFIVLMNINIGSIMLFMRYKGIYNDSPISIIMGLLVLIMISLVMLYYHFKHLKKSV